jgi:hypothetical protein
MVFIAKKRHASVKKAIRPDGPKNPTMDAYQKFLMGERKAAMLEIHGADPTRAQSATELSVELPVPYVTIRRPDRAFMLENGAIVIFEFQSTGDDFDVVRFL